MVFWYHDFLIPLVKRKASIPAKQTIFRREILAMNVREILYDHEMPTSIKNNELAKAVPGYKIANSYSPKRLIDNARKIVEACEASS